VKLALTNCQNAKRKMFAQDQSSYSDFPLFVLSGKSENSKFSYNPLKAKPTHIHTQRENNGKRIYFTTNENNENNANRGAGTACLASKNIFIDIFALFKCRILYPTQNHLVFHLSVMQLWHKIKPYFRINKLQVGYLLVYF